MSRDTGKPHILIADLNRPDHAVAIVRLLDEYAGDPMGRGYGLAGHVRGSMIEGLAACPSSLVFLACVNDTFVGVAVCFLGFSTFAGRPLLNLHDLAVTAFQRGHGVGRHLLRAVEDRARALGCCKVTLEVREDNKVAQRLYAQTGYGASSPAMLFWSKPL